ncbi:glycosyltransferase family 9 protein [Photobacterium damselae]|uniref:glycosyltransferase family 9 protein n=1 Tax=Photobacterium damselae TaxID=38293 RepID=UPI001EFDA3AD|nr:glycosyltransferase family 9 protein [Photobacterium damselae]MCG9705268.1 glycosyltransferase family 9 protein [Photobacterium damselae]
MALFSAPPQSLCILRLSAIGDVCHAIAIVQAIQTHWPQTKITWVCGKIEAQIIKDLPNIRVVVFDKKAGYKGMKSVWQQLKSDRFDALLDMQVALRASALSLGIKAKYRIGFSKNRTKEGQWWFTNCHIPNTESFHVLDTFADFARYLGVPFTTPSWHIPLSKDDIEFAQSHIKQPTLVIAPSASKEERNWLSERYAAIADYAHQHQMQVILCGSPAMREVELGKEICNLCQKKPLNLIGKTSLKQLTALLRFATVLIAPDTGPAHLATTQSTPVIGLYAHSNPLRTGPYNSLNTTVSVYDQFAEQQFGQPSAKLPWGTRVKGKDLMQAISLDSVIAQLNKFI